MLFWSFSTWSLTESLSIAEIHLMREPATIKITLFLPFGKVGETISPVLSMARSTQVQLRP